ncbi:hypothetical protein BKA57DRAFT_439503 [Linnemannia elongata]|nr:hypothetical protein BKA57DRAFT_439503 [Linnemannia elongata]
MDSDLPNEDTAVDCNQNRRSLHWLALHHLKKAKELSSMPHFNKERCLDYKEAFAALSGIWNTFSVSANTAFTPLQLQEVRALCKVQEMDRKKPEVDDLVKVLAETLETGTIEEVMEKTYDLQVQSPSLRRVLHVLQIIIRNIIRPLHGKWNPSEADALHVWSSIFHEGMPMDTPVAFRLSVGNNLQDRQHQYDAYGRNVIREANRSKFRKKALEHHEENQCSQSALETLEWETPTKPKQSKSVKDSTPVPIRPLHPGSDVQDLPSTATPSSSHHQPSKLELLLRNQPKYTLLSEAQPSEPARHKSTKSIYEEYLLYEKELGEKLKPTDGKSKHRGKLAQRLADVTEKYISHIRRIAREVDFIQDRLMQYDSLSKDEALLAAFKELVDLVELRSRDGHYSYNQAKELCTKQVKERGELKTRR